MKARVEFDRQSTTYHCSRTWRHNSHPRYPCPRCAYVDSTSDGQVVETPLGSHQ